MKVVKEKILLMFRVAVLNFAGLHQRQPKPKKK